MLRQKSVYCVMYSPCADRVSARVEEELSRSAAYCRLFDTTWLVATPESAEELYQRLIGHFGGEDEVVVMEAGGRRCEWLPRHPEASRWLKRYL